MSEFRTIPPILTKDEWNALLGHGLEKSYTFLIRKKGLDYEAVYGYGTNQAGKIYATDTSYAVLLQSVFTTIDALGGGWVHCKGYGESNPLWMYQTVDLPESGGLKLTGDNEQHTVFKTPTGLDIDMFRFTGSKSTNSYFNLFADFEMIGNDLTNNNGWNLNSTGYGVIDSTWRNIFIRDFGRDNFYLNAQNSWNNKIVDSTLEWGGRSSVFHAGGSDLRIHNCKFLYNSGSYAIVEQGVYSSISQSWFYYNNGRAIHFGGGAFHDSVTDCKFSGNSKDNNNTYDDILLESCRQITIEGCHFAGGVDIRYGINYQPTAWGNLIVGNIMYGNFETGKLNFTIPSESVDTVTIIRNNLGYNPIGIISNPFHSTNYSIGLGGNTTVQADTTYIVNGVDLLLTSYGGSGVDINIYDSGNNLIVPNELELSGYFLPIGYKISWGSFTVTPTVIVGGN